MKEGKIDRIPTGEINKEEVEVGKLIASGQRERVHLTSEQLEKIKAIVSELNVQPFGEDSEDREPTPQDWLDTVQYNLNHATISKLGLSEESAKFIKESGLFLISIE